MLFWSLLQMSVTKGMGPVMLKPHIMSTLVHLLRSTPPRLKTSGASVSPNSCRALTLKKGYSSPTVLNMAHRLLCGCWGHPIGHTSGSCCSGWVAVEVDGGDDGGEGVGAAGVDPQAAPQDPRVPLRGPWVSGHPWCDTGAVPSWRPFCRQILGRLLPLSASVFPWAPGMGPT